jgi:hypothetical protein
MTITVHDLRDSKSPLNTIVVNAPDLAPLLESARGRPPFFCLLECGGYALLVGIAESIGCAQHSTVDRAPPYLMAVAPDGAAPPDLYYEFLSGNEPSEVPARYCVTWPQLHAILVHFASHRGARDPRFAWEELGS